ncbi:Myosin type-2 heavy chain 1, partial [Coemansia spiralis]
MSSDEILTGLKVYAKGTKAFFVDDAEAWVQAELTEKTVDAAAGTVQLAFEGASGVGYKFAATFGELESKSKVLPPLCNPAVQEGIDDLTSLSHLNEPAVLHNLQVRYGQHNIYTYSGIVLVALNPFARVALYSQDTLEAYAGRMRGELEPHLFAISEDAFQGMVRDKRNQTIVVSGESGAGKTMSAKYIMRYFASAHEDTAKGEISRVEEQILATNPVLEAFGNAKTTRNDNSSRFGKFVEIRFNERHAIEAAVIRTYLLERSRLVYQPETERNYHVFYQLLAAEAAGGTKQQADDELGLGGRGWEAFHYTRQGGSGQIANVDDACEYANTASALDVIGVSRAQQTQVWAVLAALLHVGNIDIQGASERVGASVADDDVAFGHAARLLGVDAAGLRKWLTKRQIVTRSEKIVSNMTRQQAMVVRDSVAKFVYAHLFDWVVRTINGALAGDNEATASFIGVLDIYGFEHFERNSFEQFCINYANEKLQQNFNRHVFKLEQEEYQREQLKDWTFVDFQDNQPCIDLIEGKLGVLALLDEECRLQQGSDGNFAEKLIAQHAPAPGSGGGQKAAAAAFFRKPRFGADAFTIRHYAHDVEYAAEGFVEKNRDTVPDEIQNVLRASTGPLLPLLLGGTGDGEDEEQQQQPSSAGAAAGQRPAGRLSVRAARKPTLGTVFKHSLASLMETIEATESHYIRCIKPNEAKQAWGFDAPMVLAQLRACGVLETIRISCAGYPSRLAIPDFIRRYRVLVTDAQPTEAKSLDGFRELAARILDTAFGRQGAKWQVGLTKVFFRAGMLALIEKQRVERLNAAATAIQALVRSYQQRRRFVRQRASARVLQTAVRGLLARRRTTLLRRTRAATAIQAAVRGFLARATAHRTRSAVVRLQALVRATQARKAFAGLRRTWAATRLQQLARGYMARVAAARERFLVTRMQARVRHRLARRAIEKRRDEARSAAHFQQVTYQLEGKLMALTRQLDESQARVAQLSEALRQAHVDAQRARDARDAEADRAAADLGARIAELETARADADGRCEALRAQVQEARGDADALRQTQQQDRHAREAERRELEQRVAALEAELRDSQAQLEDVRAQHQKQLLIHSSQPAHHPQSAPMQPEHSSIKRSEHPSRWHASAGLAATGYDMPDALSPSMRVARQQQQQQQQVAEQRPRSIDQSRANGTAASPASKPSTVGADEGRTLARMLSSLGGFGSSSSTATAAASAAQTVPEADEAAAARPLVLTSEEDVREMLEHDDQLIVEVMDELVGELQVPLPN